MEDFPLGDETYQVLGGCFEVYNVMGCGFLESVYQECLEAELAARGIPYSAQEPIELSFKGKVLQRTFCPDFVCFGRIILELKAVRRLAAEHRAQVINYLKASGLEVGLLANFGAHPQLEYERIINQRSRSA